ncbi:type II toxin-antitoxin system VapC family toxin [Candidatus Woesearchaeota archaeon]|nr:type II toxin-antitoxin system VapC family toxin [Candidatus Woesearchaeota archaeon]
MYLDANFFILANFSQDKRGTNARNVLKEIIKCKKAVTSSLALDEVMWVLFKNNKKEEIRSVIEEIYSVKNLEVKEVSSTIPLRAVSFIEIEGLKPRDAFHTAVMEQFGVTEIVSDDADFDKIDNFHRIKL